MNKKAVEKIICQLQLGQQRLDVTESQEKRLLHVRLDFNWPITDCHDVLHEKILLQLSSEFTDYQFDITLNQSINAHAVQANLKRLPQIKNIIAVASGKGGVGKSTTTVNLALALKHMGARVGILDADIYGPNQPHMLGTTALPTRNGDLFVPVEQYGLYSMSIGYLIDAEKPMVWRGPMVSKALQQLLFDTDWPELDYLLIDMPPGTGDIPLTLAQKIPVSGAVIVSTPQDIALLDARKGLEMFRKVNINLLGVIENMALHICSNCGHKEALFGEQGADALAAAGDVPLLGRMPLNIHIRQDVDQGKPTVVADPSSELSALYIDVARNMAMELAKQKRDYRSCFGDVLVQDLADSHAVGCG